MTIVTDKRPKKKYCKKAFYWLVFLAIYKAFICKYFIIVYNFLTFFVSLICILINIPLLPFIYEIIPIDHMLCIFYYVLNFYMELFEKLCVVS